MIFIVKYENLREKLKNNWQTSINWKSHTSVGLIRPVSYKTCSLSDFMNLLFILNLLNI